MTYVLAQPVEGGVLVFHTLTRALLLLTPEEYAAPDNPPELRSSWFRVPQEMDDIGAFAILINKGLAAVINLFRAVQRDLHALQLPMGNRLRFLSG